MTGVHFSTLYLTCDRQELTFEARRFLATRGSEIVYDTTNDKYELALHDTTIESMSNILTHESAILLVHGDSFSIYTRHIAAPHAVARAVRNSGRHVEGAEEFLERWQ